MDGIFRAFHGVDTGTLLTLVVLAVMALPVVDWVLWGNRRPPSVAAQLLGICVMFAGFTAILDLMAIATLGRHIPPVEKLISTIQDGSVATYAPAFPSLLMWLAVLGVLTMASYGLYRWIKFKSYLSGKVEMICSACFEIVKMVENCNGAGWKAQVKADSDVTARFVVDGTSQIIGASSLLVTHAGLNPTDTLLKPAEEIREFQRTKRGGFLRERGNIRRGVSVLYQTLHMGNFASAYLDLVAYMEIQVSDTGRTMPQFSHLKAFFDLPTGWPSEADVAASRRRDFTSWDYRLINLILWWGRNDIADALRFQPPSPEGKPEIEMSGKQTLKAFRKFLHAGIEDLYEDQDV